MHVAGAIVTLLVGVALAAAPAEETVGRFAVLMDISGPIGPATSDYVTRGLDSAAEQGAAIVVLRMDTPGGLDTSMREIIRAILASPVPVVSYVAPSGARAASAGTYISYAAHVAAMAPGTNLGAATPVQIGPPGMPEPPGQDEKPGREEKPDDAGTDGEDQSEGDAGATEGPSPGIPEKAINDAAAYIKSLAELRGRNAEWAVKAVRQAASLGAEDALREGVIDLVAVDVADLMDRVDGRTVKVDGVERTLSTAGATISELPPDWRTKLLAVITNPNVAYLLMIIGFYGLIIEFWTPGLLGPGIIGAICLVLGLYALHVLPVNYAGLALTLLGLALMTAEALSPSFGVLGIGGLAAFVIGSTLLIETDAPGFQVAWPIIGSIALAAGGVFMLTIYLLVRSRHRAVVAGPEHMIGSVGPVVDWDNGAGHVRVEGEVWRAQSDQPLRSGDRVRVTRLDGLNLEVAPDTGDKEDK